MKQLHILHVDTDSQKLKDDGKLFGWAWSKIGLWTKFQYISRMN